MIDGTQLGKGIMNRITELAHKDQLTNPTVTWVAIGEVIADVINKELEKYLRTDEKYIVKEHKE
jgi:hypothetical protein